MKEDTMRRRLIAMAAAVCLLMALAPVIIVYVLAQKNIIEGMASAGGIKG